MCDQTPLKTKEQVKQEFEEFMKPLTNKNSQLDLEKYFNLIIGELQKFEREIQKDNRKPEVFLDVMDLLYTSDNKGISYQQRFVSDVVDRQIVMELLKNRFEEGNPSEYEIMQVFDSEGLIKLERIFNFLSIDELTKKESQK